MPPRALALFKLDQPFLLDQVVRFSTGGRHVHCELAIEAPDGRLHSFSALYPNGVLRADPARDPFFQPPQRWTALDVSDVLLQPQAASLFLNQQLGKPYNSRAYLTYLLPLPLASQLPPAPGFTCSQLVAHALLAHGKLCARAKNHLRQAVGHCAPQTIPLSALQRLAPQDLYEALLLEPRARRADMPRPPDNPPSENDNY